MNLRPCFAVLTLLLGIGTTPATAAARKPHIVFILADDLGWGETGCYGQKKIPTPHIDQLAAEGLRFTQHYSGAPVCAPSRCVLLTGQHLGHAEIRGNQQAAKSFPEFKEGQHPLSSKATTIASVLQKSGYRTAAFGKWGLGPVGSSGDPARHGFATFFGYNCQAVAHSFYPASLWQNDRRIPLNNPPVPGHAKLPADGLTETSFHGTTYSSHRIVSEAESFIASAAQSPNPIFLYLPFTEPHVAMHPPTEEVNRFPRDWDPQPYQGENGYLPHARPRAAYAAMIHMLDQYVGRIRSALAKANMLEDSLIIFTSDNGTTHAGKPDSPFHIGGADPAFFNSTAGLRGFKGSVYEGGLRVPCIVRWPNHIKANTQSDFPCYFADWFPTLCAAADLAPPTAPDGENLLPVLTGAATPDSRKPMLWVFPEYTGQIAVRIGPHKVIRRGLATRKPQPWELYHLPSDPSEKNNLATARPELIRQALDLLRSQTSENQTFPLAIPD
jgi:arylsulfatase A-like enzyme